MKKVEVDKNLCIGCGACMEIDKEVFGYGSDGLSEVRMDIVEDTNQTVILASESCPTAAIKLTEVSDAHVCECGCDCEHDCDCNHDGDCDCDHDCECGHDCDCSC